MEHCLVFLRPLGLRLVEADLAALDPSVDQVVLAASSDGDTFDRVRDLRILLYDAGSGAAEPLAVFEVKPETGEETAIICGELYRRGEGWKFRAVGQGYPTGLIGLATAFGISVDEAEEAGGAEEARRTDGEAAPDAHGAAADTSASAPTTAIPAPPANAPAPPPVPPAPPAPAPGPAPAYGYPQSGAPQPAYGYPHGGPAQPGAAQPGHGQPAYGYPQPAAAAAPAPDPNFRLPPMGPQFVRP
ncbi:TerD family protein [Streptomyces lavendulocolor]